MAASVSGGPSSGGSRSDMISAVSQLVASVSSTLKTTPFSIDPIAIEDVLAQLESTDKNFHRLEVILIRMILYKDTIHTYIQQ